MFEIIFWLVRICFKGRRGKENNLKMEAEKGYKQESQSMKKMKKYLNCKRKISSLQKRQR